VVVVGMIVVLEAVAVIVDVAVFVIVVVTVTVEEVLGVVAALTAFKESAV